MNERTNKREIVRVCVLLYRRRPCVCVSASSRHVFSSRLPVRERRKEKKNALTLATLAERTGNVHCLEQSTGQATAVD